jgi:dihydrodipicolinate synthase/N-acetylneuraminate lyase
MTAAWIWRVFGLICAGCSNGPQGKTFIFNPLGSTGEFYAMSDEECKAVIKTTVEEVNGKLPIFAGAGRPGTMETVKMCKYAESVGVDGVQVILPYYFTATEEGDIPAL